MDHATLAPLTSAADAIAHRLAAPPPAQQQTGSQRQSLADGALGVALLHIERALAGISTWETAYRWLATATDDGVIATPEASLLRGAPAIAFTLHTARTGTAEHCANAQHQVDQAVVALTHHRVDAAVARINRAELPNMAEFDVISGLTGIGAHLLRHAPHEEALARILSYLVRLTTPLRHDGDTLPGWWTAQDPHATLSAAFPGGHANLGIAHGITVISGVKSFWPVIR